MELELWRGEVVDSGEVVVKEVLHLEGSVLALRAEHHDSDGAIAGFGEKLVGESEGFLPDQVENLVRHIERVLEVVVVESCVQGVRERELYLWCKMQVSLLLYYF